MVDICGDILVEWWHLLEMPHGSVSHHFYTNKELNGLTAKRSNPINRDRSLQVQDQDFGRGKKRGDFPRGSEGAGKSCSALVLPNYIIIGQGDEYQTLQNRRSLSEEASSDRFRGDSDNMELRGPRGGGSGCFRRFHWRRPWGFCSH